MSESTLAYAGSGGSDNLPPAQNGPQAAQYPSQYPSGGSTPNAAPAGTVAPDWVQQAAERNSHITPEVAQEQAKAETAKTLLEFQREANRQDELKLEQEKEKTKREEIKQGKQAQPKPSNPNNIITRTAATMADITTARTDFLVEPYLPRASVVGFYGRGETAKSSTIAKMAADISRFASTLWISSEENTDKILARHLKGIRLEGRDAHGNELFASMGQPCTMYVVEAVVTSTDKDGRAMTSDFNIYEHLEASIIKTKTDLENVPPQYQPAKPIRLIVIDTAVALTTWERQAGPTSDEGVKKLMAYLRYIAEKHDVTIAVIGHSNKGKHEHFSDSVMGARAWVDSPRVSFIHHKHMQLENHIIVRTAKSNEIPHMAEIFSVHMVHELHQLMDGPKAGLMKVWPRTRVWGAQEAEDLWDELTAKPKNEDEFSSGSHKESLVDKVRMNVVELVHSQGEPVTREMVHARLGRDVSRREWTKVDDQLRVAAFQFKVNVTTVPPHNTIAYVKVT